MCQSFGLKLENCENLSKFWFLRAKLEGEASALVDTMRSVEVSESLSVASWERYGDSYREYGSSDTDGRHRRRRRATREQRVADARVVAKESAVRKLPGPARNHRQQSENCNPSPAQIPHSHTLLSPHISLVLHYYPYRHFNIDWH